MSVSYFFSGFDVEGGFPSEIAEALRADLTDRASLLFIASAPDNCEKAERYMRGSIRWFEKAGLPFDEYRLLDDRIGRAQGEQWLRAAGCIFLMGGDTLAQIEFLRRNDFIKSIKTSPAVVMGLSAGAINMAQTALCSKDTKNSETAVYPGIGRADITIDPHFTPDRPGAIDELLPFSKEHPVYGLCDESAIVFRNRALSYFGKIYRIDGGRIEPVPPGGASRR